jgi:lipoprotein NlpD
MLGACAETAAGGPESYVVRPQDTLYSIAWRHDLDYRDLARWNHIGGDYRISVGQVLVLGPGSAGAPARDSKAAPRAVPGATVPSTAPRPPAAASAPQVGKPRPLPESPATAADAAAASAPAPGAASPPGAAQSSAPRKASAQNPQAAPSVTRQGVPAPGAAAAPSIAGAVKWVWPTDRVGAPRPVPGGGILLAGRLGQDVRAASAGRVVYSGSGLRGYGNLIIIKHGDSLLSAYAHNREMLVHDGQEVATGQVIAHMGEGAHESAILYFEIRQNGKPVDPLPFLLRAK